MNSGPQIRFFLLNQYVGRLALAPNSQLSTPGVRWVSTGLFRNYRCVVIKDKPRIDADSPALSRGEFRFVSPSNLGTQYHVLVKEGRRMRRGAHYCKFRESLTGRGFLELRIAIFAVAQTGGNRILEKLEGAGGTMPLANFRG